MDERPPITVTAGGIAFGLKPFESLYQSDHIGCLDAPVFIATGMVDTVNKRQFFPVSVCRDAYNDFPQAMAPSGDAP